MSPEFALPDLCKLICIYLHVEIESLDSVSDVYKGLFFFLFLNGKGFGECLDECLMGIR